MDKWGSGWLNNITSETIVVLQRSPPQHPGSGVALGTESDGELCCLVFLVFICCSPPSCCRIRLLSVTSRSELQTQNCSWWFHHFRQSAPQKKQKSQSQNVEKSFIFSWIVPEKLLMLNNNNDTSTSDLLSLTVYSKLTAVDVFYNNI